MAVSELRVHGYRSVEEIELPLKRINVLVGPNGCGKTNLYRSMLLLWHAANGTFSSALAQEGGLGSALWAGGRKEPVQLRLGLTIEGCAFDLACGLTNNTRTQFAMDPMFKDEHISIAEKSKRIVLLERGLGTCTLRNAEGNRESYPMTLAEQESVLSQIIDPHRYPHLTMLRNNLTRLRFYHTFRTDPDSPLRLPQVAPRTPILSHDGRDVAAALQTIIENGDGGGLAEAVADAFDGASISIAGFQISMKYKGIPRWFQAPELSDGTLRYLCLLAALMSPRPAPLLALNEPETSLHPDLLKPLARRIAAASEHSQLWITTHSAELAEAIQELTSASPVRLTKIEGATRVEGWRKNSYRFDT